MIKNFELGYTPANLKALRQRHGLTQQNVADITASTLKTAQKWETSPSMRSFANMPHTKWLKLLEYLESST
ncbi:XRE family transcriptional regulator [uncultured Neisseria sp.]|uniref:XRE family transcriptional regulator n=1 Tax=uncultured Neisseria sp. TaxID=237778 RepID=UPI0025E3AC9B|nr:XRE family transcriptional regulator [uncultured Neisseria sp.]